MRRALQLVAAFAAIGLVLAGALASREILGAASPAFAWPSPRGLVLGYPASLVDVAIYAAIVIAALAGLVTGHVRHFSTPVPSSHQYLSPWHRVGARSRRRRTTRP